MGMNTPKLFSDGQRLNKFVCYLIDDLKALEKMLLENLFEKDIQRIGAEQELCLLDKFWRPAPMVMEVLKKLDDHHFTTEHSRHNLEFNLEPLEFSGNCLSEMEKKLRVHLETLRSVVQTFEGNIILVGILPTIRRSDLKIENLTPLPRYKLLSSAMNKLRGGPYEFRIEGADELITKHNTIMFEGCNTSFQIHLQINPDDFVNNYNWALAISGPVLAVAANSPLLLGKQLWKETRIALFQQSVDTRSSSKDLREKSSRITFGDRWVKKSITEIFQEDIARYRVILGKSLQEDSLEALAKGKIPKLEALQMHNSTVYKWNRVCYGLTDGRPHLRIENRILPAGPTVVDQMANAAFWFALMKGLPAEYHDIPSLMNFDDAKVNFLKGARNGMECRFKWFGNRTISADELILKELLPIAREGLKSAAINPKDIQHYLGIIEERARTARTGAQWMLDSFAGLREKNAKYEACVAITAGIVKRQMNGEPVHRWKLAEINEAGSWINRYWKIEQIMSTDFFTVRQDDLVYFAANIMSWKHLHYIPVEDEAGNLAGLLTLRSLINFYSSQLQIPGKQTRVKDIMIKTPLTVSPETLSIEALNLMRKFQVGCLPVTEDDKLVGMVTELNFMNFSEQSIQLLIKESKLHTRKTGKSRKS